MKESWRSVASIFDDEADVFKAAMRRLVEIERGPNSAEQARLNYQERARRFEAAIAQVVGFDPTDQREREERRGIAAKLNMLAHELDEPWLETQAERIAPEQRHLADVFLEP